MMTRLCSGRRTSNKTEARRFLVNRPPIHSSLPATSFGGGIFARSLCLSA